MLKNWKSLFIKQEENSVDTPVNQDENIQLPKNMPIDSPALNFSAGLHGVDPNLVGEILDVYEKGLNSINLPGYDFYEFMNAVFATGHVNEQTFLMAFQMSKAMDGKLTKEKLLSDAEFYIGKIKEVHQQYVASGQQKLKSVLDKKTSESQALAQDIDNAANKVEQLRREIAQLEGAIAEKKSQLAQAGEKYLPEEQAIQEKLKANDMAQETVLSKLEKVKSGVAGYL